MLNCEIKILISASIQEGLNLDWEIGEHLYTVLEMRKIRSLGGKERARWQEGAKQKAVAVEMSG